MDKKTKAQLKNWHRVVVAGLCNGLSHTHRDGRTDKIEFWRQRSQLFNAHAHCIQALMTDQSWELDEKTLRDIALEGFKMEEDNGI